MGVTAFSEHIMYRFVEALSSEIGHEIFSTVLSKAGLPEEWESALRTYYGRGGRAAF